MTVDLLTTFRLPVFDQQEKAKPFLTFSQLSVPTGPYESLQMSDVGLASPYTQIGHRGNSSVASSGKSDIFSSLACWIGPSLVVPVSTSFGCTGKSKLFLEHQI